jgi:hypothetical protein
MALKILTEEFSQVEVNGIVYSVSIPSAKQFGDLQKKVKDIEPADLPGFYQDFFAPLGLPADISGLFSFKNWKSLIEELAGEKKA